MTGGQDVCMRHCTSCVLLGCERPVVGVLGTPVLNTWEPLQLYCCLVGTEDLLWRAVEMSTMPYSTGQDACRDSAACFVHP